MGDKKDKDADKKRKKGTNAAAGKALLDKLEEAGYATGYETDAGPSTASKKKFKVRKRAKVPGAAGGGVDGYETDDGYMSSGKKKSKFFRLGNKSKSQLEEVKTPEVPSLPPPQPQFRLPIAERFATTLGNINAGATTNPPLPPPVLPVGTFTDTDIENGPPSSMRSAVRFTSGDSSDHHSSGPSIFSKIASPASSPTSSSMSHSNPPRGPLISSSPPPIIHESPGKAGNRRPDPLSLAPPMSNSRAPSPSPTGSPFVVLTPIDPSAPPPSDPTPPPRRGGRFISKAVEDISLKIGPAKAVTFDTNRTPSPANAIPSSEYAAPTPRRGPLEPSPNTYSYYELPPPSPAPQSPLPSPPQEEPRHLTKSLSASSSVPSRPVSPSMTPRRGVESPFPSRPVLPRSTTPTRGFEMRAKVERYRDIYAPISRSASPNPAPRPNLALDTQTQNMIVSPVAASAPPVLRPSALRSNSAKANRYAVAFGTTPGDNEKVGISVEVPSDGELDQWGNGYEDEDDGSPEMESVLQRFKGVSTSERPVEPALGRSRSIEAVPPSQRWQDQVPVPRPRKKIGRAPPSPRTSQEGESDDRSRYPDDTQTLRSTLYTLNSSDAASRHSFMDQEKSETTRLRFLDRIEAMFDENGREKLPPRQDAIPPVPKLPPNAKSGWF